MKKEITVDELLRIEADYINKQRTIPKIHTEEQGLVPANYDDKLFFFNQKHVTRQALNLTNALKHELSKWQLTKFEMLMLLCYQGDLSAVFDNGDPRKSPYPINEMCKALDTVLVKAPTCTDTPLYRRHRRNDVVDFKKGEIRTFSSYLTTSTKYLNQSCHQLIITPNLIHTNAKALYKIRNDKGEYQVNFKRGSSFLIEKVETFEEDGVEFKRIWMKEYKEGRMIDEREIMKHNVEMAEHANGAAQFLGSLIGGQYVTKEQAREAMDYLFASTKRNIESCPYATRQEKDAEIHQKELLMNMLKQQMGL